MANRPPHYDEFYGRTCPYRLACPHLQGSNVDVIWNQNQHLVQENHQLRQRLDQLVGTVSQLEAQIAELQRRHRRQFKSNPEPSGELDTQDQDSRGCRRRKRGAPKGHPPWTRPEPQRVDEIVAVPPPDICPHCHTSGLTPHSQAHAHRQEDIVLAPRTLVTEFQHAQAWCPTCGRAVYQTGPGEIRQAAIGPVAKATAAWLRYGIGISYRKFDELFGLHLVPASALGFDHQLTSRAADLYADLRAKIKVAQTLHADETHWRVDGVNHFLWYAGNTSLSCYHIDRHRSGEVAVELPFFTKLLRAGTFHSQLPRHARHTKTTP